MALPRAPPPPHESHDTTLTLGLPYSLASPRQHARKPRLVRSSLTGDKATPSPCTECGKLFPSWKALFGHMRCHPERQWRGITPPSRLLHGGAGQFTVHEREVADSLLMLSGESPGIGKGKKRKVAASSSVMEGCCTSTSAAASDRPANCDRDHDHRCSVCNRGFASGQALGGHRRCHLPREFGVTTAAGSSGSATSEVVAATVLDLNLPPPATPLVLKSVVQGSSTDEMLDLKLGYV